MYKHYYLIFDNNEEIPKAVFLDKNTFFEDYYRYYNPSIYSYYEMIACDCIYQMILDSHLIERNQFKVMDKEIIEEGERLNPVTFIPEYIIKKSIKKIIRYDEYNSNEHLNSCRNMAKDILFQIKSKHMNQDDLIKLLKKTESFSDYEKYLKKHEKIYYDLMAHLENYSNKEMEIVTSTHPLDDYYKEHDICYLEI